MEWLYPRKNVDFPYEFSIQKFKMRLNRVEKKDGAPGPSRNSLKLKKKSIPDSLRGQSLVKKIILKGSASQIFQKIRGRAIKTETPLCVR